MLVGENACSWLVLTWALNLLNLFNGKSRHLGLVAQHALHGPVKTDVFVG